MSTDRDDAIKAAQLSGMTIIRIKAGGEVFARQVSDSGRVVVKAWRGNRSAKCAFYFGFKDAAKADEYCSKWLAQQAVNRGYKASQNAEKDAKQSALNAAAHWSVGDVAYTSWGYDQTNVEFYQVVRLLPKSVVVRQIAANSSDFGGPSGGRIAPRRYEYTGPEQVCKLSASGSSFLAGPCHGKSKPSFKHHASKWDGRSLYCSSYA
jgi:hypothetical protein